MTCALLFLSSDVSCCIFSSLLTSGHLSEQIPTAVLQIYKVFYHPIQIKR